MCLTKIYMPSEADFCQLGIMSGCVQLVIQRYNMLHMAVVPNSKRVIAILKTLAPCQCGSQTDSHANKLIIVL